MTRSKVISLSLSCSCKNVTSTILQALSLWTREVCLVKKKKKKVVSNPSHELSRKALNFAAGWRSCSCSHQPAARQSVSQSIDLNWTSFRWVVEILWASTLVGDHFISCWTDVLQLSLVNCFALFFIKRNIFKNSSVSDWPLLASRLKLILKRKLFNETVSIGVST